MNTTMILKGSLTAMAIAIAVAAASVAIPSRADARNGRHFAYPRVHMYAAHHYYQRPLIGGMRVNNNFNPDFQFGGAYGQ